MSWFVKSVSKIQDYKGNLVLDPVFFRCASHTDVCSCTLLLADTKLPTFPSRFSITTWSLCVFFNLLHIPSTTNNKYHWDNIDTPRPPLTGPNLNYFYSYFCRIAVATEKNRDNIENISDRGKFPQKRNLWGRFRIIDQINGCDRDDSAKATQFLVLWCRSRQIHE